MTANVEVVGTFTDNASGGVGGFGASLGNLGNIVTGIKSAFDLAGQAIDAAVGLFTPFVDSASESELALVGLQNVLNSTGNSAGFTTTQLSDMATKLQGVTRFSDEQIMSAETMLLRYENLNGIFSEALDLTTDYAASLGMDLTTAAQTVGKALDDPASGIGKLNTQFKLFNETEMETIKQMAENGDVAGAQALIMERLQEKVGGAAEAFGDTFAGKVDIAKNKLDDLKEKIGGAVLPALSDLLTKVIEIADSPAMTEFVDGIVTAITEGDFSGLDNFAGKLFMNISNSISDWIAGGGPEELANKVISFLDNVGTEETLKPKALIAAEHLFKVLGDAIQEIDWSGMAASFDNAVARVINNQDWSASGDAFGDAVEKFFRFGWLTGVDKAADGIRSSASGSAIGNAIKDFFVAAIGGPEAAAWWASAWENLIDHIKAGMKFGWDDIGKMAMNGIINGVQSAWGNLKAIFSFGWDDIFDFIKTKLGIASPSTVFAGFGRNIIEGLMQGWTGLFGAFKSLIGSGIDDILKLFAPFLALFGVDTSSIGGTTGGASGTFGGFGGGSTGGTTGGVASGGSVVINIYGASYWGVSGPGDVNGVYDCPSPHPLVASSGNQLVTSGF